MSRDKLEKVHFLLAHGGVACGRLSIVRTYDRNKVTCKRCLVALMGPPRGHEQFSTQEPKA